MSSAARSSPARGLDERGRYSCQETFEVAPGPEDALCDMADGYEVKATIDYLAEPRGATTATAISGPTFWRRAKCGAVRELVVSPQRSFVLAHAGDLHSGSPIDFAPTGRPCDDARLAFDVRDADHTVVHDGTHRFRAGGGSASVRLTLRGAMIRRWALTPESGNDRAAVNGPDEFPEVLDVALVCAGSYAVSTALIWRQAPRSARVERRLGERSREPSLDACVLRQPPAADWRFLSGERLRIDLSKGSVEPIVLPAPALRP